MELLPFQFIELLDTIRDSLNKGRKTPVLILLYSGIENFAQLVETDDKRKVGDVFKHWVKKWMLAKYKLPCNEQDLWSARCGIIHQQLSESDLTRGGRANEIFYSYGGAEPRKLQIFIDLAHRKAISIVLEDIILAFENGMINCLQQVEKHAAWKATYEVNKRKLFVSTTRQ